VTSLAFHPGGEVLASAGKDRTVRLWNPAGGPPLKNLEGHAAWVQGVAFFARGGRLASAGADGTVRVWDLTSPPGR
jgi:WD40 repeat protein